jgi:hypothetical protein
MPCITLNEEEEKEFCWLQLKKTSNIVLHYSLREASRGGTWEAVWAA